MARLSVILLLQSLAFSLLAQNTNSVGINTTSVDPSAIMEVKADTPGSSTKKGFLPPRVELKNQRDKVTVPITAGTENKAKAMLVYNTEDTYNFGWGHVYADNYYYWLGDRWERMVYTPLVYKAVIPREFYIEGKTRQEFTTNQLNPPHSSGKVNGVDLPLKFTEAPVLNRGNIFEKLGDENFLVKVTGTYDVSAFVHYNPFATEIVEKPVPSEPEVTYHKRAFLNLKIQRQASRAAVWEDLVVVRAAWGFDAGGFLKTATINAASVQLFSGDKIRLVVQSPYKNSSQGVGKYKPYTGTDDDHPVARGFRALLLDFNL
ncbi:hypothetical protein [Porphyromonas endodontalis]|uniref:hypothetical protein n=1 Tax=Porphyromonas endodontalis TaxID=28124 RepID=UPI0023EF9D61|nr:hypothetical protein [Porphyromonas endodontalis]